MCLIVDANVAGQFLAQPGPVIDWLLGPKENPRLVAGGKLREELVRNDEVRRRLVALERAGRLRSADPDKVKSEEHRLHAAWHCRSNDRHILALAIITGARTLATLDTSLSRDFRNKLIIDKPRGSVYSKPDNHRHLLKHTPRSCGIR